MRLIGAAEVHRLTDYPALVAALLEMCRRGVDAVERWLIAGADAEGRAAECLIQPAWAHGRGLGLKIANVFAGNPRRGLPSVLGVYVLLDGATGAPLAVIDGAAETAVKTAANSAAAAALLARTDAAVLLMMGAGAMAPHLVAAHASVRPIRRVLVWNRTAATAEALAARLDRPGLRVTAVTDRAAAAAEADIVSCATFATAPILAGAWLRPGTHVDLVGSYTPAGREADAEVVRRGGRLFVDARFSTVAVVGDVIGPLQEGVIGEGDITDLAELARGQRPGRRNAAEITVFKSGGGGHQDLATALFLYERALAEGDQRPPLSA